MREIIFRGKRTDNGEWAEGYIVQIPAAIQYGGELSSWYIDKPPKDPDDSHGVYNVNPETIGQFTGLTDRNGKKIFEGDILRDKFVLTVKGEKPTAHNYKVTYSNGGFLCCNNKRPIDLCMIFKLCEVIGNIHDNPELLEREDAK